MKLIARILNLDARIHLRAVSICEFEFDPPPPISSEIKNFL